MRRSRSQIRSGFLHPLLARVFTVCHFWHTICLMRRYYLKAFGGSRSAPLSLIKGIQIKAPLEYHKCKQLPTHIEVTYLESLPPSCEGLRTQFFVDRYERFFYQEGKRWEYLPINWEISICLYTKNVTD